MELPKAPKGFLSLPPVLAVPLAISILPAIILAATKLYTTLRYHYVLRQHLQAEGSADSKAVTVVPPPLPYTIPFLGHVSGFTNPVPGAFWAQVLAVVPRRIGACTLHLGGRTMHVLFSPTAIQALLRHRSMARHSFNIDISQKGFGNERANVLRFFGYGEPLDDSGMTPLDHIEDMNSSYLLRADRVGELTAQFMLTLRDQTLASMPDAPTGLYTWLWRQMFEASTTALMGSAIFDEHPTLTEDFHAVDGAILTLFFGIPKWLNPQPYAIRAKALDGLETWLRNTSTRTHGEVPDPEGPVAWDAAWGSRANRVRQRYYVARGLPFRARAAFDLGFIFGLSSNAIPATGWMLLHILDPNGDKTLRKRVMEELASVPRNAKGLPDVPTLLGLPLLQALFNEVMRLYVDVYVSRDIHEDTTLPLDDGKRQLLLQKGSQVFAPSWLTHRDDAAWGDPLAHVFCPERFLKADPATGEVAFTTASAAGRMIPFGGGKPHCPGRVFAKQEVLGAVAMLLLTFDFEVVGFEDAEGRETTRFPRLKPVMSGATVIPPGGDMNVKITRRRR